MKLPVRSASQKSILFVFISNFLLSMIILPFSEMSFEDLFGKPVPYRVISWGELP